MTGDVNRMLVRGEASGRSPPPRRRLRIAAPFEPGAITFYNHPYTPAFDRPQSGIDTVEAARDINLLICFSPPIFVEKREYNVMCIWLQEARWRERQAQARQAERARRGLQR